MAVTARVFGQSKHGEDVWAYRIENSQGLAVTVLTFGATIQSLFVPDRYGELADVVLGYDDVAGYEVGGAYFGATVGRVANRIGAGRFTLGKMEYRLACNNGANHLHGGLLGFSHRLWEARPLLDGVALSRLSPDGEEGYPGNLHAEVTIRLDEGNTLSVCYQALCDRDTVFNPTNHSYFNLSGQGSGNVLAQRLSLRAPFYTPAGPDCLPTGEVLSVRGTAMDFYSAPKAIGQDISGVGFAQIAQFGGYDHNYVFDQGEFDKIAVAEAYDPATGRVMELFTTMPGAQLYTANNTREIGKAGVAYEPYSAFCLETQIFPDAMAHRHFPSPVLRAGQKYESTTAYRFSAR